uniref:Uncharacterized protein n=1 Tax=Solanum lycopersicum TaxID=4081 RepID=K4CDH8_SOLLC
MLISYYGERDFIVLFHVAQLVFVQSGDIQLGTLYFCALHAQRLSCTSCTCSSRSIATSEVSKYH